MTKEKALVVGRIGLVLLVLGVVWWFAGLEGSAFLHIVSGLLGLHIALRHI